MSSFSQSICGSFSSTQFQIYSSNSSTIDFDFSTCFKSIISIIYSIILCLVLFTVYWYQDKFSNISVQEWLIKKKNIASGHSTISSTGLSSMNVKTSGKKVRVNMDVLDGPVSPQEEEEEGKVQPYYIGFIHAARVCLAAILTILNIVFFFFIILFPKDTIGFFETISPPLITAFGVPAASTATISYAVMMCTISLVSLFLAACRIGDLVCFTLCSGWIGMAILDAIRFRSFIYYEIKYPAISSALVFNLYGVLLFTEILFVVVCGFPIENWRGLKRSRQSSPELYSHFFARVFFTWVWGFVLKGSRRPLEVCNVCPRPCGSI